MWQSHPVTGRQSYVQKAPIKSNSSSIHSFNTPVHNVGGVKGFQLDSETAAAAAALLATSLTELEEKAALGESPAWVEEELANEWCPDETSYDVIGDVSVDAVTLMLGVSGVGGKV